MELGIRLQTGVGRLSDSWENHARASVAARMSDNRHLRCLRSRPRKLEHLRVHSISRSTIIQQMCLHTAYQ